MKKWLPWLITLCMAVYAFKGLRAPAEKTAFQANAFGQLPVLLNGRIQPIDSVARNSLLAIRNKQSVYLEDSKETLSATEWIMEVMMKGEKADQRPIFRVDHPQLLALLKLPITEKHFSFVQLRAEVETLEKEAKRVAEIKPEHHNALDKQVKKLHGALVVYHRLKNSLRWEQSEDFAAELDLYLKSIEPGVVSLQKKEAGQEHNEEDFNRIMGFLSRYQFMARLAYPLMVPPLDPAKGREKWSNVGESLFESARSRQLHPAVAQYAAMARAYAANQPGEFNAALATYQRWLVEKQFLPETKKAAREFQFSQAAPFYSAMAIYVLAFILACFSWLNLSPWLNRTAYYLVALALVVHSAGLLTRMLLEGRPPVTNLYSSAIFVGWGAGVLGLILERIFRNGIGSVTASAIGFLTLLVAHFLSLDGDTMIMLQAVLDTNFWLATHVVIITLGYASTFLAGFLGIVYVMRGFFTKTLPAADAKSLSRMVYGIICFATLFSFVGTVLGGIWADQSWGRFWGWDPKENGALIIVIWNALILHARWGGLVRERGLMVLSIFGNIVTSFSWFGVNMLGVGLHTYGFMDKVFVWLMVFVVSQLLLIGLGLMPLRFWGSLRPQESGPTPPTRPGDPNSTTVNALS